MATDTFPYSFKVNAASVVDKDHKMVVEPDAAGLKAIAGTYDLDAISDLKADFRLKPYRKAGLRVVGTITADITQTCVVSLEPFDSRLRLDVDRTFEPHSSRPAKTRDLNADGEIEIDLETLDPPDVIIDGVLDLGAVICEEIALSLDPFPRKPGVEFKAGEVDDSLEEDKSEEKPSPFAVLEALKARNED
ncbi:YceD family protein [Roseibium salinum]|uniref:DUF177 domain-containing protein n=1 Tax=Roseibium salinum TaxID=1604349 RepID=A0ABT3R2U6_9HYPH|nr:DUF177 domain-containing protein [Roseibium sp. DSM 29163]MCX2723292.1 DUF177 domain-containing protein [Roseibium sp. DSM 29163]